MNFTLEQHMIYSRRLPTTTWTHYSVHTRPKYSANKPQKNFSFMLVLVRKLSLPKTDSFK